MYEKKSTRLSAFATNATSQLNVLWHDRHTFGVNSAQVGVLEQTNQVRFARLLQRHDGRCLEAQIGLEILRDFTNQALKRQLANQQLGRLLVATNFSQRDRSGAETMWFLHTHNKHMIF